MTRWQKFRMLRRGYYALWILVGAYVLSFFLPLLMNNKALIVHYQGRTSFPIYRFYAPSEFGSKDLGVPNYRELKKRLADEGSGWVLMPPYPYSPTEALLASPESAPSRQHIFGTDDRGRDVFARLAYGFNVSLTFAGIVLVLSYAAGVSIGALLGYFGGKVDLLGQRGIEIWSAVPVLYTVIVLTSLLPPSFWLLVVVVSLFNWMGITYYVRGEFYREKSKDYVTAAVALGASSRTIVFRHILPNAMTPVISFAPFALVSNITALVALDFLEFGLPSPTPSWGELINQGMMHFQDWWLVLFPLGALFVTLMLIVFVGESLRSAFDPRMKVGSGEIPGRAPNLTRGTAEV
jgi:microcin C transport system permease protein